MESPWRENDALTVRLLCEMLASEHVARHLTSGGVLPSCKKQQYLLETLVRANPLCPRFFVGSYCQLFDRSLVSGEPAALVIVILLCDVPRPLSRRCFWVTCSAKSLLAGVGVVFRLHAAPASAFQPLVKEAARRPSCARGHPVPSLAFHVKPLLLWSR